ncbi:YqjF family protein [Ilumatobacter coccineus]|nr:DUF2071 domain-containing protein [Ilumatobacter coccineus]
MSSSGDVPPQPLTADSPGPVSRRWLRNRWDELTFVHWRYRPDIVQALLPDGLRVDTHAGWAYVSLVPFRMTDATPHFVPAVPWISAFNETNVRTYVVDSAGNRAIWFFSLEADRLAIVAFARWFLGFPYVWGRLTIERRASWRRYVTARRRWPKRPASSTTVAVEIGDVITEPSGLDVFLTARWGTVTKWPAARGVLRHHPVDHQAWTLHEATLTEYADASIEAAGLPTPSGDPIVRYAQPVDARFGRPTRV